MLPAPLLANPGVRRAVRLKADTFRQTDVADAILYALDTPWRVNISTLEIVPNEQSYGGLHMAPVERG